MSQTMMKTSLLAAAALVAGAAFAGDDAQIERGRYLATAGDCVACHTAPQGQSMAGGLALASPMGAIYSTNITPSKTHGIGNYTLEQFSDALRHGKRADGANLYPAMPYTSYAKTSDEDIAAMYAYFMQGVAPVDAAPAQQTSLPFPFNIRASLGVWNAMFHDATPYKADASKTPEWNRGAYLAQGLAHCTTCHTPRTSMMAEDHQRSLAGGVVGAWDAPNITSDVSGIAGWSEEDLVKYMSGQPVEGKGPAAGPMAEAIDHSLKHLSAEDLKAIAVYIKSVPAVATPGVQQGADSFGQQTDALDSIRGVNLPDNYDAMTGAQLYDAYCATCHQAQGQGTDGDTLPALFHNTVLGHTSTNNLVQVMLHGIERHGVDAVMPGFAHELSDKQITTLGNYLLTSYGNPAAKVTEQQVAQLRDPAAAAGDSSLVTMARFGIAVVVIVVLAIIAFLATRRRK
jgi:mono/diheme cytochrome c family protein